MARVEGFEPNQSGQQPVDGANNPVPVGVWGDSDVGVGVFGSTGPVASGQTSIPIEIAGVEGHGFDHSGVVGRSLTDSGVDGESRDSLGVLGRSSNATGVLGVTFNQTPGDASGVFGSSVAEGNGVTGFVGSQTGVVGSSVRGTGVRGVSTGIGVFGENVSGDGRGDRPGVFGASTAGSGVHGASDSAAGVRGTSTTFHGVVGVTNGLASGAHGLHFSTQDGSGVSGTSILDVGVDGFSFAGTGVRGESNSGLAGDFVGNVRVTGAVFKGGGGFRIDHPLDPENLYLTHSFVESPEMLDVYSGTTTTDADGVAEVRLPDYFEALNSDFRYQLTVLGEFAQAIVAREISDNGFAIRTDRPQIKVCWQVTGVRGDRWAQAHRIAVESRKSAAARGRYLHPELWAKAAPAIGSHTVQVRGSVVAALPEQLRDQGAEVLGGDTVDRDALVRVVEQARQISEGPERTAPGRLEEDWLRVQDMVRRATE